MHCAAAGIGVGDSDRHRIAFRIRLVARVGKVSVPAELMVQVND